MSCFFKIMFRVRIGHFYYTGCLLFVFLLALEFADLLRSVLYAFCHTWFLFALNFQASKLSVQVGFTDQ